ncbi:hypothetical protein L917_01699 [Phytophthora nicotianae]|uniref:Uncharacterized protein n=1 Tax=Phytophthora nicotianae TaxID=4792 RepID=W2LYL9_PHYNI|nr:hypothetical protein L917_01699 [Phytophthora nicotianae]
MSRELFETDNGDISSLRSTVVHFPGVESLRQVFEALWFYLTNMEISISERLGHITFFEEGDPKFGGEPYVIVASNCADEDELYPYNSSERVRKVPKNISGGIVMTASTGNTKLVAAQAS